MIFFVIMYAMSNVDQVKFVSLSQSLAAALHKSDKIPLDNMGSTALISSASPSSGHQTAASQQTQEDKNLDNLFSEVKAYIQQHNLQGNVSIVNEQRGVQITLKDVVLFDTGDAAIKPAAQGFLKGLVPFFKQLNNPIVIEGYTDDQPISTPQYPTNWELSSGRALDVLRFFIALGVNPERLSGVAYGQYHNIEPNTNAAGRQANRRVNIVILRESLQPGTASYNAVVSQGARTGTSASSTTNGASAPTTAGNVVATTK